MKYFVFLLVFCNVGCQQLSTDDVGIDVSNYQSVINWSSVRKQNPNLKFAIVKGTEGASYRDPSLVRNFNDAKQAGLRVGMYHYFRMSSTPAAQFENIQKALKAIKFDPAKDIFAIDFETTQTDIGLRPPKSKAQKLRISNRLYQLAQILSNRVGIQPLIYTNPSSWNSLSDQSTRFNKFKLWIAQYMTTGKPIIPKPWSNYYIWQYTDQGSVSGIRGRVDMNLVGGTGNDIKGSKKAF